MEASLCTCMFSRSIEKKANTGIENNLINIYLRRTVANFGDFI